VDRIAYLTERSTGRRVIHLGFLGRHASPVAGTFPNPSPWLHEQLAAVASELVGIDIDAKGVATARDRGYEVHVADLRDSGGVRALQLAPAKVVIAGELIEHLEEPATFLRAVEPLVDADGTLIVTTPNAASILNPLAAMRRYELHNPGHVAFYSFLTLSTLLERSGWRVERAFTYHFPFLDDLNGASGGAARLALSAQRLLARRWPFVDFGLIVEATPRSRMP
jgi:hypothetical protein